MDTENFLCRLEEVEKRYERGTAPALGPLSACICEHEILGIKGPNGAGKSTLLKMAAGVVRPGRGRIVYAPNVKGQIGYVPQELSLYQTLTGMENLRFWGLVCGLPSRIIPARSKWILEQVELTEKGDQKVSSYSGGMKRRIHLATALMSAPRLLLLDEPTVGADTHSVDVILTMLLQLRDQGCGIVLISHSDHELKRVCDRVLTLDKGIVVSGDGV